MAAESLVLKVLGSAAWDALKGLWDYFFKYGPRDIEELKEKMTEVLEDLEFVSNLDNPAERTNKWIFDVRELVCDIEDVINKCKHPGDKKANNDDKIKKKIIEIKKRIMSTPTYFSLSGEIRQITDAAVGAKNRYERVNTALGGGREDQRYVPLLKQRSDGLKGIDRPMEKIISLLDIAGVTSTPDDKFEKSIGHMVVSIVGVGGLGKTTLAGQVYNQVTEQFQCKARVFVSRNRPPNEILKNILQEFRVNYNNLGAYEPTTLVELIQEHVQDKRFLVVFDDVWNNDLLEIINTALFGNQRGGRIIITTRNNDVAEKWCCFHPMESNGCCPSEGNRMYQLKPLNEQDSRILLLGKASYLERPQKSKEYIDQILAKCSGSPLALSAASDLAVQQKGRTCWKKVYESMNEINADPKIQRMRVDLSHSYFDLPYRQRDCLLYLSLFPNDEINKKRLMSRWFAEGLIDDREEGKDTFKDLVDRNLILPPEIKYDGDESTYQAHRTIHDFAVWKSAGYNFITLLGDVDRTDLKIRRISVHKNTQGRGDIRLRDKKFPHLRSLSMLGPGDLPVEMSSNLRVLDLEDCNNGCLKPGELFNHNLKYLKIREGLKGFECNKLMEKYLQKEGMEGFLSPENLKQYVLATQDLKRIGSAKHLQTLDLRGFGTVKLDAAITDLEFLARLLLDPEATLPHGISKMVKLEELEFINVSNYDSKFFAELVELPNLRAMGIFLSEDSPMDKQFLTSLQKLVGKGLSSLFIDGDRHTAFSVIPQQSPEQVVEQSSEQVLERSIRKLRVRCPFNGTPKLTNSCKHLERLRIGVPVTNLEEELSILAGFYSCSLTHLYLDLSGSPQDVTTFSGTKKLFPHLKCLGIQSCSLNMTVKFPRGAPEHLKLQLQADDCKEPQELPVGFNYASINFKSPARDGNGNNQVATTWTTVHITTPRQENHNKEVVVAITIASRSATLNITENEINSCIGDTSSGQGDTEHQQIREEGRLDIIMDDIEQNFPNTKIEAETQKLTMFVDDALAKDPTNKNTVNCDEKLNNVLIGQVKCGSLKSR